MFTHWCHKTLLHRDCSISHAFLQSGHAWLQALSVAPSREPLVSAHRAVCDYITCTGDAQGPSLVTSTRTGNGWSGGGLLSARRVIL
jgi:hypothetical protein